MSKKYKLLFLLLISVGLLASWSHASALELNYPTLSFAGTNYDIAGATSLAEYIRYFFIFFIAAVGICAAISITYYGGKILLLSTVGNPEVIAEARQNIFGSILGIVLLLFAYILLSTINPELVILRDPAAGAATLRGVYYSFTADKTYYLSTNGSDDMGATMGENDNFWRMYADASQVAGIKLYITYYCDLPNKNALVWLYDRKDQAINPAKNARGDGNVLPAPNAYGNNQEASNVRMVKFTCRGKDANGQYIVDDISANQATGNRVLVFDPDGQRGNNGNDILSWYWKYEDTGAYFYLTKNCTGIPTTAKKETTQTPWPYSSPNGTKTQSVRITNSTDVKEVYGVYLTKNKGCYHAEEPIINPCQPNSDAADTVCGRPSPPFMPAGQTLSETVDTRCYTIPQVENLAGPATPLNPDAAYIFHYRKNNTLTGNAIRLYGNYMYADLTASQINGSNAPVVGFNLFNNGDPMQPQYWKYVDNLNNAQNPDKLLQSLNLNANPMQLGQIYNNGTCTVGTESTCLKYLSFNYRKSYTVFLHAEGKTVLRCPLGGVPPCSVGNPIVSRAGGYDPICEPYEDNAFLPYQNVNKNNRYIYRMDVIPTFSKAGSF